MRKEFRTAFIRQTLGSGIMHYEDEKVNEGLLTLNTMITTANDIIESNKTIFKEFRNLDRFYGFVQNGNLAEDNLFYDLNIESEPGVDTENLDSIIEPRLSEVYNLLDKLKKDIENTVLAIKGYNSGDKTPEELAILVDNISLEEDYKNLMNPETASVVSREAPIRNFRTNGGKTSNVKKSVSGIKKVPTYSNPNTVSTNPIKDVLKMEKPITSQTVTEQQKASPAVQTTTTPKVTIPKIDKEDNEKVEMTSAIPAPNQIYKDKIIEDFTDSSSQSTKIETNVPTKSETKSTLLSPSFKDENLLTKNKTEAIKNIHEALKEEPKSMNTGSLASSITSVKKIQDTLKKPTSYPTVATEENTTLGQFVPPIAGIATAGATGMGTKVYLDKKGKSDKEEDEFFSNVESKEENKEVSTPLSKEDLLEVLDKDDGFNDINNN